MTSAFDANDPLTPSPGHVENAAYREGRLDERDRLHGSTSTEIDDAYARGVRDGRTRRRGSPLLTLLLLLVVIVGGVMIYLAIDKGSFSSGGAVVDQKISHAAATVVAPVRGAADSAGTALQNAGADLKHTAGSDKP